MSVMYSLNQKAHCNMSEKFCLKWNDFDANVSKSFAVFRTADYLHDVTLVSSDHRQVTAHKLVLSASSEYFRDIFKHNNNKHAHPLLCLDAVSADDLQNILDYIYNGEIQIYQDNLDRFLAVAQRFRMEGLMRDKSEPEEADYHESTYPANERQRNQSQEFIQPFKTIRKEMEDCPPTKDLATMAMEKVTLPISAEDVNDINNINEHLERCDDGKFRCNLCGKTAARRGQIRDHIEGVHLEGISIPCPLCQKTFGSRQLLRCHKYRFHK